MDFNKALGITETPAPTGDTPVEPIVNTPAADTPPADATPAIPDTPPAEPPVQSQLPNTPAAAAPGATEPPVDVNSYLDKMSDGLIKDDAGFKAVLAKIAELDQLKATNTELAAKMAQSPFADDEVRILNELKAAGATKDQIKSFHKINEYGSIKEMPDRDARIAKMVMIDGVKPSVAELKVDREFKLNDESLSTEEREILDDDLRVAANLDKVALEKFKAEVSSAVVVPPEEIKLQEQANILSHQAKIKPYVAEVVKSIPNLGSFELTGAEATDKVKYDIPIDDTIRGNLGQFVEAYFMDGLTPVTPDNTRLALQYARAEYFRENAGQLIQDAYQLGVSNATEKIVAKYENRGGIPPQHDNPVSTESDAAKTAKFMANKVNRVPQ